MTQITVRCEKSPELLTLDLRSGRLSYKDKSVTISDMRRRLITLFSELSAGEVITENRVKDDIWGESVYVERDACAVAVRSLLRIVSNLGCPPILQREYNTGWKRTAVSIVLVNRPVGSSQDVVLAPPSPTGVDLLFAHVAKLRSQYPWVMETVLRKWKHGRARAKQGVWSSQAQVNLFSVLTRMYQLQPGSDLPDGNDAYTVCIRAEDRFAWIYRELCRAGCGKDVSASEKYVALTDRVIMSYDSWICFGYDTVLSIAYKELEQGGGDSNPGRFMYEEEENEKDSAYSQSAIELHHIASRWYPAIDPCVPFGQAVVRFL